MCIRKCTCVKYTYVSRSNCFNLSMSCVVLRSFVLFVCSVLAFACVCFFFWFLFSCILASHQQCGELIGVAKKTTVSQSNNPSILASVRERRAARDATLHAEVTHARVATQTSCFTAVVGRLVSEAVRVFFSPSFVPSPTSCGWTTAGGAFSQDHLFLAGLARLPAVLRLLDLQRAARPRHSAGLPSLAIQRGVRAGEVDFTYERATSETTGRADEWRDERGR